MVYEFTYISCRLQLNQHFSGRVRIWQAVSASLGRLCVSTALCVRFLCRVVCAYLVGYVRFWLVVGHVDVRVCTSRIDCMCVSGRQWY